MPRPARGLLEHQLAAVGRPLGVCSAGDPCEARAVRADDVDRGACTRLALESKQAPVRRPRWLDVGTQPTAVGEAVQSPACGGNDPERLLPGGAAPAERNPLAVGQPAEVLPLILHAAIATGSQPSRSSTVGGGDVERHVTVPAPAEREVAATATDKRQPTAVPRPGR